VPLLVGGEEIGLLRVDFPASVGPAHRDVMALQAYADALAAALHDAATHHELRDRVARAARDAQHDPATGLLNRAAILSRGETSLQLAAEGADAALLLLDIKRFREINDTLGHSAGDEVLRVAARRLAAAAGPDELLGRLGGDEFALLVTGVPAGPGDPQRRAVRRARELVESLAVPAEISAVPLSIEVSVGVVTARAGTIDMIELLRRADVALHQAKRGGSPVAAYDNGRDSGSTDRLALLAELRGALATDDELVVLLQPAVELASGRPVGVEALVRWNHPRRGRLYPVDFVRTVENSDLLGAFTRRVLDRALAAAAAWAEDGITVPVAVNLSARNLLDSRLPAEVNALLRRHRVPPRRLVLEITETVMMSELAVIDEVLAGLRALGVQLAVDDFGTGFSSLSFLTRIPVDEVKVDRTFVTGMVDSNEAAAIVRATVELGKDLGVRVVAEGVETVAQRRKLAELGCTAAQGHLFAEPLPADQIGAALRSLAAAAGTAQVLPLTTDTTPS
jgi:diguanylate cyclase (GGDEF)-like protein